MYSVRPAKLDDTCAITQLFQARIPVWQRVNAQGRVENLPLEQLTIYERWTHGSVTHTGAWMSVETSAIHLSRLLRGAGLGLVAEHNESVIGYAEVYPSDEPHPFGKHLHLAQIATHDDHHDAVNALFRYLFDLIDSTEMERLTVSLAPNANPYPEYTLKPLATVRRHMLAARTGQGFYKVNDHPNSSAAQIEGWQMPVGRIESAAHLWETFWTRIWDIIPEIEAQHTFRLYFNASGHEAFICCQQQPYNPRTADIYCWSPKPLTPPLLTALRDWAYRQNYRTLALTVTNDTAKILGNEAEPDPYIRHIYALER